MLCPITVVIDIASSFYATLLFSIGPMLKAILSKDVNLCSFSKEFFQKSGFNRLLSIISNVDMAELMPIESI